MVSSLPKLILTAMAGVVALVLAFALDNGSSSLEVTYEGALLKIQNVGDAPVEIKDVVINDRTDCAALNVIPQGNILKVGDSMVLMPLCEAVRVTVSTANDSETYNLR
jgi:hypothetical protein